MRIRKGKQMGDCTRFEPGRAERPWEFDSPSFRHGEVAEQVDGTCLENRRAERPRGFESHSRLHGPIR